MPGNWFELKNKDNDKLVPLGLEEFKRQVTEQINGRSLFLDNINSHWNHKARKVNDISFILDEERFQRLIDLNENETRHPIITFHGTNANATAAILRDGYRAPGVNGGRQAHGSMYGPGVYSSHFVDKACCYVLGNRGGIELIVNLLFLGTVKMIPVSMHGGRGAPKNGIYPDNSNTHVVFGLDQVISADPERVVPIATLRLS